MKKTLGMVFFLTVLAGMAGCGQKNTANTTEQTDTQTEKTLEEHFFSAEQDEQNYNVMLISGASILYAMRNIRSLQHF